MSWMRRPLRLYRLRPAWWLGLLLGAWLAAQTLGLAHREMHGLGLGAAVQALGQDDAFHGHHAPSDCRLYDHAGVADLLPCPAALVLPALAALAPVVSARPVLRAAPPPPFHARGPPALR